ncbi:MAG: hypothetical protein MJK04_04510, partial [Psychrosphaera sp.]|nr:hypothetical protein [Psychrosphaera sp.]
MEEAILFGFFIHQCSEAISHNIVDDEGYFPISEIKRDALPMLREQRQRAMVSLMIRGYLALKRNVSSNTKLYKVYIKLYKLYLKNVQSVYKNVQSVSKNVQSVSKKCTKC